MRNTMGGGKGVDRERPAGELDPQTMSLVLGGHAGGGGDAGEEEVDVVGDPAEQQLDEESEWGDCFASGDCEACKESERDEPYCLVTGRRQEWTCEAGRHFTMSNHKPGTSSQQQHHHSSRPQEDAMGGQTTQSGVGGLGAATAGGGVKVEIKWRQCGHTHEDDKRDVAVFMVCMFVMGVLSCLGIKRQRTKSMSLYERRARGI